VCFAIVISLFVGRMVQLQGLDSATYRTLANRQRLETITIPAVRGSITASDGTVLAMTVQTDLIFADPAEIKQGPERLHVATALAGPLQMAPLAILALLNHPSSPQYVVLKKSITLATANRITSRKLPGLGLTPSYTRIYPNGDLAASLLGFTDIRNGDLTGAAGLELKYNPLLSGKDGSEQVETGPDGQPIPLSEGKATAEVPARNLRLTIQPDIQYEAEQQCRLRVIVSRARDCTIVVMQPRTGRILAMAQWPTFNPAAPKSYAATANIAVSNLFAPGSTAKVITVAAALDRGGQTPMSAYTIPDQIVVDGYEFHDSEFHPTVRYTVAGILAHSSNVGMVQVVQHVSPQQQYHLYRAFGIGSPTGLGLPGENAGILPPPSKWTVADGAGDERYELSFGQSVAVNAVQMASVYATIANGGVRVQPSLVAGATSSSGTFRAAPPAPRRRVLQPKTARELMGILQQVPVVDASAGVPWGLIAGYSIAAKTGTAQEPDPANPRCLCDYGSSYIGIAPATRPQVVVAVNVQDPRARGYFGDEVAGPVFYNVMRFALQTLKIPPDGGKRPNVRLTAP
jgi:cell division protein FtsI (penicillin-binding protein 3)